ncbi:hypothetical protein GW17_00037806 [Ensete ventricosum]|nr:hypothetical protein GW17_00037806 [Ensete ventricosum]RZS03479.1 hypothetical protein BHM03_00033660 [Ensete ventricosum]
MTVGPTVPSKYRLPFDSHYGLHLFTPAAAPCMRWLDSKPPASVVYVSFGSMAVLGPEQTAELAFGIADSDKDFLWVVRSSKLDYPSGVKYRRNRRKSLTQSMLY